MRIKRKRYGINFLTTLVLIVGIFLIVLSVTRFYNINRQKERLLAENSSLIAQSEALSDKLKQIRAEEEFGKDNTYVESVARTQLDMVYPGEIIFRVNGEKYQ